MFYIIQKKIYTMPKENYTMPKKIILFTLLTVFLSGCEDPIPNDNYQPTTIVTALLIINEPIQDVQITKTLPLNQPYDYSKAIIDNAQVFIYECNQELEIIQEFELVFHYAETLNKSAYYATDTAYRVKKNTTYNLKIILPDETVVTGTTTTPADSIEWIRSAPKYLQYPLDTINLPTDSNLYPIWTPSSRGIYFFNVTCLDTLNYGKYLSNPTNELNRRIYSPYRQDRSYRELSFNSPLLSTNAPLVWRVFKYFGLHRMKVYVTDKNYETWLMFALMTGVLNEKAYSVKGCAGYFASAFVIKEDFVILKNQ
jgi:hypothetical protein